MADPEATDLPIVENRVACRHLRHNGMYLFSPEELADYDDGGTNFWCLQTQKVFGPDDGMVNRSDCCTAERRCYEPL
jgi:hypothetical protein